jgi:hypothetical protein
MPPLSAQPSHFRNTYVQSVTLMICDSRTYHYKLINTVHTTKELVLAADSSSTDGTEEFIPSFVFVMFCLFDNQRMRSTQTEEVFLWVPREMVEQVILLSVTRCTLRRIENTRCRGVGR